MNGNGKLSSARGVSEAASGASDEMEPPRPAARGKGKRGSNGSAAAINGRRKAEEAPAKQPASKKAKTAPSPEMDDDHSSDDGGDDDDMDGHDADGKPKSKMTDEEKRKNFLERNRYVSPPLRIAADAY